MASHLTTSLDHSWRSLMHVERVSITFLDEGLSRRGKNNAPVRRKPRATHPITYFGGILNNRNDPTRLLTVPRFRRRKSLHKAATDSLDSDIDSVLLSQSWYREARGGVRRSQASSRMDLGEGGALILTGKKKARELRNRRINAQRSSSSDSGHVFLVQNSVPKDLWAQQRTQYAKRSRTSVGSSRPRSQAAASHLPSSSLTLFCNEGIRKSVESDEEIVHPQTKTVKAVIIIPSF